MSDSRKALPKDMREKAEKATMAFASQVVGLLENVIEEMVASMAGQAPVKATRTPAKPAPKAAAKPAPKAVAKPAPKAAAKPAPKAAVKPAPKAAAKPAPKAVAKPAPKAAAKPAPKAVAKPAPAPAAKPAPAPAAKPAAKPAPAAKAAAPADGRGDVKKLVIAALRKARVPMSVEQLNRVLGAQTGTLAVPLQEMIAAGQLVKSGVARGTKYGLV